MQGIAGLTEATSRQASNVRFYCDNYPISSSTTSTTRTILVPDRDEDPYGSKNSQLPFDQQEYYDQVNWVRRALGNNGCQLRPLFAITGESNEDALAKVSYNWCVSQPASRRPGGSPVRRKCESCDYYCEPNLLRPSLGPVYRIHFAPHIPKISDKGQGFRCTRFCRNIVHSQLLSITTLSLPWKNPI